MTQVPDILTLTIYKMNEGIYSQTKGYKSLRNLLLLKKIKITQ